MHILQSIILHVLFAIVVLIFSAESLSKVPPTRLMVKQELEFPNDEKHILVRRISYSKDMATLHAIQVIQEDQRYFVEDDYEERNAICQAMGFQKAFNEKEDTSLTAPIISFAKASQMVRLAGEDHDELLPYNASNQQQINMIEILPCAINPS